MTDIPAFTPEDGWLSRAIWEITKTRWMQGHYPWSGGAAAAQGTPDMTLAVDAMTSDYGTTAGANVSFDAAHATYGRMDILYQKADASAFAVYKGVAAAIYDPMGNYVAGTRENWQQLVLPKPAVMASLPAGVPMYLVYIGPAVTGIESTDFYSLAQRGISGGNTKVSGEEQTATGTSITLPHSPAVGTFKLFKNGVRMKEEAGAGPLRFTRVTTAVTLGNTAIAGDWFSADYEY